MERNRIAQSAGALGFLLLLVGSALYAINSPQRTLTLVALGAGAVLVAACALLSARAISSFFKTRSARYGANMAVMIVLFTGVLVIVQALAARHAIRYDFTRNKRFSLSPQTVNVLRGLQRDVDAFAFFGRGAPERLPAEELLGQYAHESARFRFQFIDPDQSPQRARDMGVTTYGTVVVQLGDRREPVTSLTEETLTNAILKLTRDVVKSVYFITGHGEKDIGSQDPDGYAVLREAVVRQNYSVKTVSLFDEPEVPDDSYVLVAAGPKSDYFEAEIEKVERYLAKGKNAVFLIDPQVMLPNLESLLADYRIRLDDNVVIDPYSRVFGGEYTVPVVTQYVEHPITETIDLATFYPMARSVRILAESSEGVTVQYLAQTGRSAWGETNLEGVERGTAVREEDDVPAPVPIAAISTRTHPAVDASGASEDRLSKIVVFGDSDFADNGSFSVSANGDLLLNVVNFLAEEKDLVAIRSKEGLGDRLFLTASQGRLIFLVAVVLLPLAVLGFGTTVFVRRRRLV